MADTLIQPSLAQDPNVVALAALAERITYMDVSPVVTHDIDRVPASALPHLADQFHMRHTVAWRRAKTDAERRGLVKAGIQRHRIKGTLAGFRLAATDAGAELVRAVTPPAKLFASPALTLAERNAFIARYPQLRLYRYRVIGQRQGAMLHRAHLGGGTFPLISDAWLRILPRAYLWRDGVEVELTAIERTTTSATRQAETVTEVRAPGQATGLAFCALYPRHLAKSNAASRIYRVRLAETYQEDRDAVRRTAVQPGLSTIDVHYDQIAMPGQAVGLFAGQLLTGQLRASPSKNSRNSSTGAGGRRPPAFSFFLPESAAAAHALRHRTAAQPQAQGALARGVVGGQAERGITRQHLGMGMAERVLPAARDQHAAWRHRLQEGATRRAATAVVRCQQPVGAQVTTAGAQPVLAAHAKIAAEQQALAGRLDAQQAGSVVGVVRRRPLPSDELDAIPLPALPLPTGPNRTRQLMPPGLAAL